MARNSPFGCGIRCRMVRSLCMKILALSLGLLLALPASAQEKRAVEMTDQEIEAQATLNHKACQAVGLSDGGQTCQTGAFLNAKLTEAKKPKPEPAK